jgi:DNA-binding response OmpR family regulator
MLPLNRQTVLLIEADTSLRRLIALGLQYRGMRVIEASSPTNIPSFTMEAQPPSLIVLDIDGEAGSDHSLLSLTQANPSLSALPTIVLAWECLVPVGRAHSSSETQVTCLTKPFDARTLHATIEQFFEKAVEQEAVAIRFAVNIQYNQAWRLRFSINRGKVYRRTCFDHMHAAIL